jgi:hypothetical protein
MAKTPRTVVSSIFLRSGMNSRWTVTMSGLPRLRCRFLTKLVGMAAGAHRPPKRARPARSAPPGRCDWMLVGKTGRTGSASQDDRQVGDGWHLWHGLGAAVEKPRHPQQLLARTPARTGPGDRRTDPGPARGCAPAARARCGPAPPPSSYSAHPARAAVGDRFGLVIVNDEWARLGTVGDALAHLERAARSPRQPVSASGNPAATGAGETRARPGVALVGVGAQARPGLQPGERRHVRVVEREVEQRNILPDP